MFRKRGLPGKALGSLRRSIHVGPASLGLAAHSPTKVRHRSYPLIVHILWSGMLRAGALLVWSAPPAEGPVLGGPRRLSKRSGRALSPLLVHLDLQLCLGARGSLSVS